MNRTCIIVSSYFPPSTLAGVHRARHLAKHLPTVGWTPIVVCVDEAYHEEGLDPALAALVPSSVEIVKVPALPSGLCRPLGFGEISLRAWRPLRAAVMRLLKTRDIGAVLITGSPYYPMLLGSEIKRRFGVPVVLDFQDPWVSAWGATRPRFSKAGVAHLLSTMLEPSAIASADFITSVSETQNREMRARYPRLRSDQMAAIPIGGDPADYDALRVLPISGIGSQLDVSYFNLSYVGTIWPPVLETLRTLLAAVVEVRSRRPDIYKRLRLNFIGTTQSPNSPDGRWVRPLAEALGVEDVVWEEPKRQPYLDALSLQARSDAILMLGSAQPHYTASKIYGAMMSGQPYLGVFHQASSSHEILGRAGGGITLGFDGAADLARLVCPLADAIVNLVIAPDSFGRAFPATFAQFTAAEIAKRYGRIFDDLGSVQ